MLSSTIMNLHAYGHEHRGAFELNPSSLAHAKGPCYTRPSGYKTRCTVLGRLLHCACLMNSIELGTLVWHHEMRH